MIVLVSLIVIARGFPCFHDFLHSASTCAIISRMIFPLVALGFVYKCSYMHAYMCRLARAAP